MTPALHLQLTTAIVVPIIIVAVGWLALSVPHWRQVSWRDQMDTPLDLLPKEARLAGSWAAWKVLVNQQEVARPSLVLLRVRNSGLAGISDAGVRRPVTFTFPGRNVIEYAVTDCRGGITWDMIAPSGGTTGSVVGNRIILPAFPMQRRAGFRLLVLLTGDGHGVLGKGRVRGGRVIHETRRSSPRVRNIVFGTVLALLVGTQAGVALGEGPPIPSSCASGQLVIQGSTAFTPAAQLIGQQYTATCRDATISVTGTASFNGLDALSSSGALSASGTPGSASSPGSSGIPSVVGAAAALPPSSGATDSVQIAMSDGPAPPGYRGLVGHPVAVIIFAVVVNKRTGVFNLTTAQLRAIFSGHITNWRQVGGSDLPISIVARTSTSGTRRAFETHVLGGPEAAASSYDCVHKNRLASSSVILCEKNDTPTLLQLVNTIPGAIGYAQISDAESYANVEHVNINTAGADIADVKAGIYPYWTVEYLYTYGHPAAGSLTAAFLAYMSTDVAKNILLNGAYTPCQQAASATVAKLCARK